MATVKQPCERAVVLRNGLLGYFTRIVLPEAPEADFEFWLSRVADDARHACHHAAVEYHQLAWTPPVEQPRRSQHPKFGVMVQVTDEEIAAYDPAPYVKAAREWNHRALRAMRSGAVSPWHICREHRDNAMTSARSIMAARKHVAKAAAIAQALAVLDSAPDEDVYRARKIAIRCNQWRFANRLRAELELRGLPVTPQ